MKQLSLFGEIHSPVKIEKKWDSLSDQSITDSDGGVFIMADVVNRAKDLEVMEIPMKHLCIDFHIENMTIRTFVQHMRQVLESDLSYPILLDEDGAIFDGRHRVIKALVEGLPSIKAKRFEKDPSPSYYKDKNEKA